MAGDFVEIKRAAFLAELAVKDNLQQEVPQLFDQLVVVAGFDGIEQFIDFLDRMPAQRAVVLLAVPGTTIGRAQSSHNRQQIVNGRKLLHSLTIRPNYPDALSRRA